jgi:ATP-dependent DNA helicase RecQ
LLDSAQVKVGEKPVSPIPYQEDSLASKAFVKENIIDSTIKLLEKYGILQRYNLNSLCRVKLNGSFFSIIDYFKAADENKKMIIEAILRTISSEAFNREVDFDRARIIEKYNVKEKELEKIIKQMESAGLMTYEEAAKSNGVLLLQERQPIDKLRIDFAAHDKRRKRAYSKLDIVMNYAATAECKRNFLLEYFQEDDVQGTCGRCSSCMATESPVKTVKLIIDGLSLNSVEKKILFGAKELNGRYGRTILAEVLMGKESEKLTNWGLTKAKSFGMLQEIKTRHEVIAEIDKLIEDGTLALTPGIYPLVRITESGKKQLKENPPEFKPVQKNSAIIKPSPLFDRLSRLREQFAKENNMLASQLIDTNTLKVLSSTYPMSILDFNRIAAGKTYFLENFSMAFFNEIIDYYDEQERLANPKPELPDSVKKSIEVINHAGNLELAAKKLNISTGELARQVQTAIEYGISLNRGLFIKPKEYEEIKKVVSKQPNLPLKDIRAKLGFDCDYSILRIAVAFVRGEVKK